MLRTLRIIASLFALALPALAQGPVVLMGIDAEDGNGAGSAHGGKQPYIDVLQDGILPNVGNGGSGVLVIGGGKSAFDDVTLFWDAVASGAGTTTTHVNGAANITAQSFAGFAVIAVASSSFQTGSGGLTNAENDALTGRAADIADHVNGGGGLFCTSQDGLTTPYGYLGSVGAFTFNFPAQFDGVTATPAGEAIGITDTNLDVCCWHDEYLTFPGFLDVLATNDDTGNPCALGGFDVIIVQGIVLTPLFEVNPIGTDHTVTATVADNMGNPVVGTLVTFEVTSGPHAGTMDTDVTDGSGQAFFTYTGVATGVDTIEGCFTDNMGVEQCDEAMKEWIATCYTIDFETDEDGAPMAHGTKVDTEFDSAPVVITGSVNGSGMNTLAILDSDTGPAAQDPDLLVGTGNILILQTDANTTECPPASGIYCTHNDDEDGGTMTFAFSDPSMPMSVRLIDVDATDLDWTVVLTDAAGAQRTYTVPANWTGDLTVDGPPGMGTLDLTILAAQPGFGSSATAVEDAGFDESGVVTLEISLGGSGAVDDLSVCTTGVAVARAGVTVRNGSGVNRMLLDNGSLPVVGGTWAADLDCSAFPGGIATLSVCSESVAGTMTIYGERLIGGALFHRANRLVTGAVSHFTWNVPSDPSLVGLALHAQGSCRAATVPIGPKILQARGRLSNALDLTLGF